MHKIFLIIFIFLFAVSCKKNNAGNNSTTQNFVKGEVIVGIDSTIAIEQVFNDINSDGLIIAEVSGYVYTTTIPADSIPYIKTILNSKKYIDTGAFLASVVPNYQTQVVYNESVLWNMSIPNQQDFITTKNLLRMTDNFSSTKNMLLKVPTGQEEYWKNKFQTLSWVKWTELNFIAQINLGI
jgi:hypothetical protein